MKNPATVATGAGYTPVYKGKWHCSKPAGKAFVPADLQRYGFDRWDPPDGGANQDIKQAGGGFVNHDGRYIQGTGSVRAGHEGALQYLSSAAAKQQPFFMVVSLVNPHDVLFYPNTYRKAGYNKSWFKGQIGLPGTVSDYLNFYANLMRSADADLVQVLDKLRHTGLLENTLVIRTADHGEMGLAHGGLRQKNFNFYEEACRVPLIYSNPTLFPRPMTSDAMVSHVDFLPTLASLIGAPRSARSAWQGVDCSQLVLDPGSARPRQDYTVFTFDDYQSGQPNGPYPQPPNHVVSIREHRWKLAKYYDVTERSRLSGRCTT
jgi:choline-sulfatase